LVSVINCLFHCGSGNFFVSVTSIFKNYFLSIGAAVLLLKVCFGSILFFLFEIAVCNLVIILIFSLLTRLMERSHSRHCMSTTIGCGSNGPQSVMAVSLLLGLETATHIWVIAVYAELYSLLLSWILYVHESFFETEFSLATFYIFLCILCYRLKR